MKRIMMIMVLGALVACLVPANAQDWKSTSSMPASGSTLAPQVTTVGATNVAQQAPMASTPTSTFSIGGPRKSDEWGNNQDGGSTDENSPIGDAVLPLSLMALAFCGVVALRRRKAVKFEGKD